MLFQPPNTLTCVLIVSSQPDTLPTTGAFASIIGHYSKLAKRSPIPSLGAVSEACSVLSLRFYGVLISL